MKNNNTNDYMFLTAKELAKLLLYGNKKLYNFTFDKETEISRGQYPSGWYGIELHNMFDSRYPNLLSIGYWGGGENTFINLDSVESMAEKQELIEITISEIMDSNQVEKLCVEIDR